MRSTKSSETPTFITFWNSHGLFWKEAFIMWCSSCATYLDILNILALHLFTWALCKTRKRNWRMRFKCVSTTHDFSWVILERRFHLWWSSCVTYFDILPFCEPFSCVFGKYASVFAHLGRKYKILRRKTGLHFYKILKSWRKSFSLEPRDIQGPACHPDRECKLQSCLTKTNTKTTTNTDRNTNNAEPAHWLPQFSC